MSSSDNDRLGELLLGLAGDDEYVSEDEDDSPPLADTDSIFGLVETVFIPTAESSLLKIDLNFATDGLTDFNAGLKPVAHKPKVSSPLAVQPVLTMEEEVTPVTVAPEALKFGFSSGRTIKSLKGADAHTPKFFTAGGFSDFFKDLPEFEPLTATRKRPRFGDDDTPVKKAKLSHDFSTLEAGWRHDAPELLKVDFLSGDGPSDMMNFAAGRLLTIELLEANEAPVFEPLTANRKRSSSDHSSTQLKKVKMSHEFSAPKIELSNMASEVELNNEIIQSNDIPEVNFDFSPVGRPIKALKGSRTGGSTMKIFQAGVFADALEDNSMVEPLLPSRKRSCSSSDAPVKKAKLSASIIELVQTLLFDVNAYVDGQLSLAWSPLMVTRKNKSGMHAAKVSIWRDAIKSLGAVMSKVGGNKDGLGGLREKYLAGRGGKITGSIIDVRKMAWV